VAHIPVVILAAGESTRFGRPKQLLDWFGKPLVAHVVDVAASAGLGPVVVVLGCSAEAVSAALGGRKVRTAMNWRWAEGLSTSLQAGLSAIPPESDAVVFLQCDQPLVTSSLLRDLAAALGERRADIVHSSWRGRRGTPALFAKRHFPELASLKGDVGGRDLIKRHPETVVSVDVGHPSVLEDIDFPDDYERLVGHQQTGHAPSSPVVLRPIRSLILDMDGVLWRGSEPIEGLRSFFAFLHEQDISYVLATNNSSRLPEQYAEKLAGFGVHVDARAILTSGGATASYLASHCQGEKSAYLIGEEGLRRPLLEHGFALTDDSPRHVVVGWDTTLTWQKLATATRLVSAGASFVGTNPDVTFPSEGGNVPGNGAQLAALQAATGVHPVVIGKPESWMYEEALARLRAKPEETAVVGDRLDTDILGGNRAGIATILLLSGVAKEDDLPDSQARPDLVLSDITQLEQAWREVISAPPRHP
jgi:4-nitrophenyl phosphatase